MEYYDYYKALHIIFVVAWFAGLFYIPRLFIYDTEANQLPEIEKKVLQKQFKIMQKRLWYGITYPAMIIALLFGFILGNLMGWNQDWLVMKLFFVAALVIYHLMTGEIFSNIQKYKYRYTSQYLRIWNEAATLLLVAIVFMAVLKNTMDMVWGIIGFFIFTVVLLAAIYAYKKIRK